MKRKGDVELLNAWAAGDSAAGEALFHRYFDAVYRFFQNKLGSGAIDDLVQQTFLGCIEARERFRGESSFRSFLFQIARHQLFSHFRGARRDRQLDFTVSSVHDLGTSPTGILARHEDEQRLLEALQRLPLEFQVVLELVFWEDLTGPEIAYALAIPENTAYSRVRRAKQLLREALAASSAAALTRSDDDLESWLRAVRPASVNPPDESR